MRSIKSGWSVSDIRTIVAQEFAEVFLDYVKKSGEKFADGDEILQVDTYPLTIYSAAAVQELHDIVKTQNVEIAQLKEQLSKMKVTLSRLVNE